MKTVLVADTDAIANTHVDFGRAVVVAAVAVALVMVVVTVTTMNSLR